MQNQNRLFVCLLVLSAAGHIAARNLRLEDDRAALSIDELEQGRTSISVQLVAAPTEQQFEVQDTPEPMERLTETEPPIPEPIIHREAADDGRRVQVRERTQPEAEMELAERQVTPQRRRRVEQSSHSAGVGTASVTLISQEATGAKVPPSISSRKLPTYPPELLLQGVEGKVTLVVSIDRTGKVSDASVRASSGHQSMDQAAIDAVKRWRFSPAKQGSTAIAARAIVPVEFKVRR